MKPSSNHILVELTNPPNDSWRMIVVDSVVCTALFGIATGVTGVVMNSVDRFVDTRMAIVYLPVWSMFMLIVPFYARRRGRLSVTAADLLWAIPVLLTFSAGIDLLGPSSLWVVIIASGACVATGYIRSMVHAQMPGQQHTDEPRDRPESPNSSLPNGGSSAATAVIPTVLAVEFMP